MSIKASEPASELIPVGLNLPEASKYSGLTVWNLRQAVRHRKLPFIKQHGYIILRHDLDAYLERIKYKVRG